MAGFLIFWSILCWLSALVGVLASFTAASSVGWIVATIVATLNSLQAVVAMIGAAVLNRLEGKTKVGNPVEMASERPPPSAPPPG